MNAKQHAVSEWDNVKYRRLFGALLRKASQLPIQFVAAFSQNRKPSEHMIVGAERNKATCAHTTNCQLMCSQFVVVRLATENHPFARATDK